MKVFGPPSGPYGGKPNWDQPSVWYLNVSIAPAATVRITISVGYQHFHTPGAWERDGRKCRLQMWERTVRSEWQSTDWVGGMNSKDSSSIVDVISLAS